MKLFASQLTFLTLQAWFSSLSPNISCIWVSHKVSEKYQKHSTETGMLASSQPCRLPLAPLPAPIPWHRHSLSFCPWPSSLPQNFLPWKTLRLPQFLCSLLCSQVPIFGPISIWDPDLHLQLSVGCPTSYRIFTYLKQHSLPHQICSAYLSYFWSWHQHLLITKVWDLCHLREPPVCFLPPKNKS